MNILNALKGISGEYDVGRSLVGLSGLAAIVSPIAFQAWEMAKGGHFDVTAWCIAYPGGLAALAAAGILSIGNKDKNVAVARQTQAMSPLGDKGGAD